jgi:hypothetical protein
MGSLRVSCPMEKFNACICAFFNLIEHQIGASPIERYPCIESGVVICSDLFRDILLHVQCLPWLADLWIAIAQFCQDTAQGVEHMVFIIPALLLEAADGCLRCVDGTLETKGVPITRIGAGEVGMVEECAGLLSVSHQLRRIGHSAD